MTDVRLTATNPEDSSVVPVACNAKGELKLEEPTINSDDYVAKAGDTMTGNLHLGDKIILFYENGSAEFAGTVSGQTIVAGDKTFASEYTFMSKDAIGLEDGSTSKIRLSSDGSAQFAGLVNVDNKLQINRSGGQTCFDIRADGIQNAYINADGSATFAGDVVIGSRNKKWMIVESGGIAHLVEQTRSPNAVPFMRYPELRNIPHELDLVEQALSEVMEKLRMKPPAGWPVWDGSDED